MHAPCLLRQSSPPSGPVGLAAAPARLLRAPAGRTTAGRILVLLLLGALAHFTASAVLAGAGSPPPAAARTLPRATSGPTPGQAEFVRSPDTTLYFSPHLLPPGEVTRGDVAIQLHAILDALSDRLESVGSDARHLLRLTIALADESDHSRAAAVLAQRFADHAPAVTWLGSPLPEPGARVAVEAIAASTRHIERTTVLGDGGALLPAGERIFVSGQAERGTDPAASVALTMASLLRSAAELGGTPSGVAQIRVFLQPFSARSEALAQITPLFPTGKCPPVILTEWTIPLPVEIEMVLARDPGAPALEAPLVFPVLAGKPRSPRFSHAAVVASGVPLIFLGGLDAGASVAPADEWTAIFARLGPVLARAGSSFRLLAKATYLLEDDSPRTSLNDNRAVYYDPLRPPAASAVGVRSVGIPGRTASLDLIAVPRDAVPTTP